MAGGVSAVAAGQGRAAVVVTLRVTIVQPPAGVHFCLQEGRDELVDIRRSTGADLSFDMEVRLGRGKTGVLRFLGSFVQGPLGGQFLYVRIGTLAGQADSPWTRRAKVPLHGIPATLLEQLETGGQRRIEARYAGTAKDGGPACATVPLLDGGWRIAK